MTTSRTRAESGWSPLRYPAFRRWWLAQLTSNVGSWMQTVAAQWLMLSLTTSAVLVGAIQATNLPVLLLSIPGGVLGDLVDRKRLVLFGQFVMLLAAAALGGLAAAGLVTPALLLILLCGIGVGQGLTGPTATTLQPELVPAEERSQAIALGSVNQNLARAIGPAIGGALLAATSAAVVFFVNSLSFIAVLAAVALTTVPARKSTLPREHAGSATRAGGRFVRNSPALIAIMVRAGAFSFFAAGVWALLPLVARHTLGLGSGGYGLLLGCVGIGALLGATVSPSLRRALSPRALVAVCAATVAAPALVLAVSHAVALDGVVLVFTGAGWIIALGLFNASFQSILPPWVKARAMAYYLFVFQGALGIGSLALATVAQATSVDTALIVLAAGLAISTAATWPLALPKPGEIDVTPAEAMPLPDLEPTQGPVLIVVTYSLAPGSETEFLAQRDKLRHFRGRTGGFDWRLYLDGESPTHYVETYLVGSWEEHERQHARATEHDQQLLAHIDTLLAPGTHREPRHYLAVPAKS
ncbi:MAG TPA: MFS transporter [Solirubrobacteraceae bacterium]|nr:MFS transporter [Solirubrobacteraceae bacterium]